MEFTLQSEYIELIKLLKMMGVAETGGHAKQLVEEGFVQVNDEPEDRKRRKLRAGDTVRVEDTLIRIKGA